MGNTSSRTLRLLALLQSQRQWTGDELAQRLATSVRTLRRDIQRLRDLGYPVQADRGVDGGYHLAAGAALPPLSVEDDEAVALAIGLRAAAQGGVKGLEEASIKALTKIVRIMPPKLRRRVDALDAVIVPALSPHGPRVDASSLTLIAQACRDQERIRFSYTARSGEHTTRNVEPHRLVSMGPRWYLVAFDVDRHDWRSFRLDRLTDLRGGGARFRPRRLPAKDAADFVRAGIRTASTVHTVEAIVHAPAAQVAQALGPWGTVHEIDATTCRLVMTADVLDWPAFALGAVGAEFEIVSPPEMIEHVREWGARFRRAAARRPRPA